MGLLCTTQKWWQIRGVIKGKAGKHLPYPNFETMARNLLFLFPLILSLSSHQMIQFSLKWWWFQSNSFFAKKMSFDDILMTTWVQENESERKKDQKLRAYKKVQEMAQTATYHSTVGHGPKITKFKLLLQHFCKEIQ